MTPDAATRDAVAAVLRAGGLFKYRAFADTFADLAADIILADLTARGCPLHPADCPGPLDVETLAATMTRLLNEEAARPYARGVQAFADAILAALAKPAP